MPSIVTICQPRYLPAANFFHRMMVSDVFIYLDTVKYSPSDWENRNKIKTQNGPMWLTVPVQRAHLEQKILETEIDYKTAWPKKHLASIQQCYARAPHFRAVFPEIEACLQASHRRLMDLNRAICDAWAARFGIGCRFVNASELPGQGAGQHLLVSLCEAVGGDLYLSGALGRNYLNDDEFRATGLQLAYHDYDHPDYPQLHGDFLPWMSALDMLMMTGDDCGRVIRHGNLTRDDIIRLAAERRR